MRFPALVIALFLTIIFDFGCAKSNPNASTAASIGKFYSVVPNTTDFYQYGPQQGNGPDKKLPRGTLVTVIRRSFGYAKVKLSTGDEGFVASEDIRVAPAELVAAANPTPTPAPRVYPEPTLPSLESTPAVEPTPIPAPPSSRN
jgi:hypothetical protein